MNDRTRLEALSREIEAANPGALTRVIEPQGKDRPWVIHVYRVPEGQLPAVNAHVASAIVDAMDQCPTLDVVGMAHSVEATARYYANDIHEILLRRALDARSDVQNVLGQWICEVPETFVVGATEPSPSLSGWEWSDVIETMNVQAGQSLILDEEASRPPTRGATYEPRGSFAKAA